MCMRSWKKMIFAGKSKNNSKHCCHIATKFNITHGSCNLIRSKKKSNNKMLNFNINDDFDILKQMHCMSRQMPASEVVKKRSSHVKILKELTPDDENESCICRNMKSSLVDKMSKANDTFVDPKHNETPTITQQEKDDDDTQWAPTKWCLRRLRGRKTWHSKHTLALAVDRKRKEHKTSRNF